MEETVWEAWLPAYEDDPYEQSYWQEVSPEQAATYFVEGYQIRLVAKEVEAACR